MSRFLTVIEKGIFYQNQEEHKKANIFDRADLDRAKTFRV
jgi:hypothetical protein